MIKITIYLAEINGKIGFSCKGISSIIPEPTEREMNTAEEIVKTCQKILERIEPTKQIVGEIIRRDSKSKE